MSRLTMALASLLLLTALALQFMRHASAQRFSYKKETDIAGYGDLRFGLSTDKLQRWVIKT